MKKCVECEKEYSPLKDSQKYCSRKCAWANNGGHNKKDGISWWKNRRGYIVGKIKLPDGKRRQIGQHRYFMQIHLGRTLEKWEDVHHINGIKTDNSLQNLMILDHRIHTVISNKTRKLAQGRKQNLSPEMRAFRSERAKKMRLADMGRATLARMRQQHAIEKATK